MNWVIVIAIISPFVFGFMNVFDKYVVSHKVKNPIGFTVVSGLVNVFLGLLLTLLLMRNLGFHDLLFPMLAGIFSGFAYYFYFFLMKNSDATYVVGFAYLFPIVVAILSFIFIRERLPLLSYAAIAIILMGVVLLSLRAKKVKVSMLIIPLLTYIVMLGLYEFFIKVSTVNVSFMQGVGLTTLFSGLTVLCGLFFVDVRRGFVSEIKNIKWALMAESITLIAVVTLYFAMTKLDATVVSSIASIQPLAVLVLERFAHNKFGKMTKDKTILSKTIAIILIVIGVALLSFLSS